MNKKILKIALLSVSMLVAVAPAINANIPAMKEAFPQIPLSMVEMITTIPSLFLMISVLTSGFIAKKIGYKQTIMLGLGIVAISGIIPVFIGNFYLVLFSRAALGFGIGLFNSLLIGLISYFFDGNERTTLIGYHEALGGLGGMLITYIAGQLMHVNWQAPFISYAIAIPVFFIFWKVIPKVKTEDILHKNTKQVVVNDGKEGNFSIVFVFMILIVIGATLNMTMGIKVSSLIVEQGYGSASDASTVIMLLSLGAMISGFLFGKMYNIFKNYIMSVGFTITALAMFIIGISNTSWMTVLGGFLVGFGFRVMMPCLTNIVNSSHLKNPTLATSLLLVAYNLGSAFAPYGSMLIQKFSWTSDLRGVFYVDGIGFICLAVIVFIVNKLKGKQTCKE
nr:MFS transporter [uncultured Faecalibacillus sp.]